MYFPVSSIASAFYRKWCQSLETSRHQLWRQPTRRCGGGGVVVGGFASSDCLFQHSTLPSPYSWRIHRQYDNKNIYITIYGDAPHPTYDDILERFQIVLSLLHFLLHGTPCRQRWKHTTTNVNIHTTCLLGIVFYLENMYLL